MVDSRKPGEGGGEDTVADPGMALRVAEAENEVSGSPSDDVGGERRVIEVGPDGKFLGSHSLAEEPRRAGARALGFETGGDDHAVVISPEDLAKARGELPPEAEPVVAGWRSRLAGLLGWAKRFFGASGSGDQTDGLQDLGLDDPETTIVDMAAARPHIASEQLKRKINAFVEQLKEGDRVSLVNARGDIYDQVVASVGDLEEKRTDPSTRDPDSLSRLPEVGKSLVLAPWTTGRFMITAKIEDLNMGRDAEGEYLIIKTASGSVYRMYVGPEREF